MSFSITHIKTCLLLAGSIALVSSCQDYEPFTESEIKNVTYNREFEKTFGPIDPNHDWSMATRVTANIDLSHAPEGTYEVKIFSEKEGYLLTKAIVENQAQLSFDAIKGESSVRILARKTSALGLSVINGYYPIVDGVVNTAQEGTRAQSTADQCNTTVGAQIDLGTENMSVPTYEYVAANGEVGTGTFVTTLSDDVYYIATIAGESYIDGADGNYSVTYNGQTSQMNMHEIADILENGSSYSMFEPTTKTVYSDDQTNWKAEYMDDPNVQEEVTYQYHAQQGTVPNNLITTLSDGTYYIFTIDGESYGNGDNGKYSVYYNGTTTQYDMYQIADIISAGNFLMCEQTDGGYNVPWGNYVIPAYYSVQSRRYYLDVDGYYLAQGAWIKPAYYHPTTVTVAATWRGNFYHLNDVYKSIDRETQVKFEDLLPLVSSSHPNPYFHEQDDNRTLYEDILDYDIEYVLTEDGPITYTYVFYGSIYHNWLGYFYWHEDDNMTEEQKKQAIADAPRYVFMEDTYPTTINEETGKPILQCYNDQDGTGAHTPEGMQMPVWVDSGQEAHAGHYLQGTTYHLAYFGENYNEAATYTFPEGLHVAFFLITKYNGANADCLGNGLFYSIQDMNNDKEVDANGTFGNNKHWWAAETNGQWDPTQERPNQGEVAAVTYSYKGNIVMGFEDDNDKDENDMLFLISAPIVPPISITTEEENSWIVACEDLGGTYDYDFNDLVFEVTLHTTTTQTIINEGDQGSGTVEFSTEVLFRPLAAGGTMPATVYLGETEIGEIHDLLSSGASTSVPINVGSKGTTVSPVEPFELNTGETYYTDIAGVLSDIKIVVTNTKETNSELQATEIVAPNRDNTSNIPQMLLLPKGWDWPNEEICIYDVYPLFEQWAQDQEKNGWIEDPVENNINTSYFQVNPSK